MQSSQPLRSQINEKPLANTEVNRLIKQHMVKAKEAEN